MRLEGVRMSGFTVEVVRNLEDRYYWQIKSRNKKIVAKSIIYTRKEMCVKMATKIEYCVGDNDVKYVDMNNFDEEDAYLLEE